MSAFDPKRTCGPHIRPPPVCSFNVLSLGATMKRREFITLIGGAAAWPLTVRAQSAVPVIGLLGTATASEWKPYVDAFYRGLSEVGYVEGRNVAIEARWANSQYERLPAMAADLIQRQTTVIVALSTPAARVAKTATATIPVVFTTISDPVQMGVPVANLIRLAVDRESGDSVVR